MIVFLTVVVVSLSDLLVLFLFSDTFLVKSYLSFCKQYVFLMFSALCERLAEISM